MTFLKVYWKYDEDCEYGDPDGGRIRRGEQIVETKSGVTGRWDHLNMSLNRGRPSSFGLGIRGPPDTPRCI